jgi:hypothetical protein
VARVAKARPKVDHVAKGASNYDLQLPPRNTCKSVLGNGRCGQSGFAAGMNHVGMFEPGTAASFQTIEGSSADMCERKSEIPGSRRASCSCT